MIRGTLRAGLVLLVACAACGTRDLPPPPVGECGLVDSDGDGVLDGCDGCPADVRKVEPGACGCGALDSDQDGDGVADCIDECRTNPNKSEAGACGCAVEDDPDGDGMPNCLTGCADGQREGFLDVVAYPRLAGCSGAFRQPGLRTGRTTTCGAAGDDSSNPMGTDCSAADLCQVGWHVCRDKRDVELSGTLDCADVVPEGSPELFFATGQETPGNNDCDRPGFWGLIGCGNTLVRANDNCRPLNRSAYWRCRHVPMSWDCGDEGMDNLNNVAKPFSYGGGVLCCRD